MRTEKVISKSGNIYYRYPPKPKVAPKLKPKKIKPKKIKKIAKKKIVKPKIKKKEHHSDRIKPKKETVKEYTELEKKYITEYSSVDKALERLFKNKNKQDGKTNFNYQAL